LGACAGGAYTAGAGVIGAGSATTSDLGAALTAGFGSGKNSFSNQMIAISMSTITVKRRIVGLTAMALDF
jgi:hypothetical protein